MREDQYTELKREYTDDIKKAVIAFANTDGGIVYIGINDDGDPCGVKNTDDVMLKLSSTLRDSICPDITVFTDISVIEVDGYEVIKVSVERGTSRPYYLCSKGICPKGVYIRLGAATVPASETAILSMIRETSGFSFEASRSINQALSFDKAVETFSANGLKLETPQMKTLRLIGDDGTYTNLAYLLSDQCQFQAKAAVFRGKDKLIFKNRKEISGSIFSQIEDVISFIDFYNQTYSEVKGIYRVDQRDYPEDAVREAVFNAFIHRDYAFSGPILISMFEDRMEIVTIGGLIKGVSINDIELGVSILRNEALANIFYRLGFIEAYGTGIRKIRGAYSNSSKKPIFEASDNAFKVTLPNLNYTPEIKADRPAFGFREETSQYGQDTLFSERSEKLKALCLKKGHIVRKDVEELFSVSQPMAIIILREMTERGVIKKVGKGRNTRYTVDL